MPDKKAMPKLCYQVMKTSVVDLQTGIKLHDSLANQVRIDANVESLHGVMLDWYNNDELQITYIEGHLKAVHKLGEYDVIK